MSKINTKNTQYWVLFLYRLNRMLTNSYTVLTLRFEAILLGKCLYMTIGFGLRHLQKKLIVFSAQKNPTGSIGCRRPNIDYNEAVISKVVRNSSVSKTPPSFCFNLEDESSSCPRPSDCQNIIFGSSPRLINIDGTCFSPIMTNSTLWAKATKKF